MSLLCPLVYYEEYLIFTSFVLQNGQTVLMIAAKMGVSIEIMRLLLARGAAASINAQDSALVSVLMIVLKRKSSARFTPPVRREVPQLRSGFGWMMRGCGTAPIREVVKLLLDNKADATAVDKVTDF
jgi:hypothetical protein